MRQQVRQLSQSKGLQQSGFVVGGNLFSTGISAITLIILSRYLGPANFGLFSVAFSLHMFLGRLCDFGLNMSLQKYVAQAFGTDRRQANQLITYVGVIKLLISLVLVILGWFLGPWLAVNLFKLEQVWLIRLSIMLVGTSFLYDYLAVVFQSVLAFGRSVLLPFTQSISKLLVTLWLITRGITDVTVLFGWYVGVPILAVLMGWLVKPKWITWVSGVKAGDVKKVISMSKFTAIAIVAAAVSDHVDTLMVKSFLTDYQTGLFAAASRISLLMAIGAYSLGTVLNPRVARYTQVAHMRTYLRKAGLIIGAIGLMTLLVLPFAKLLIILTAGAEFAAAEPVLRWLLLSSGLVMATTPLVAAFYALEKPAYFALSGLIQIVLLVGFNAVLIPQLGIEGSGIARFLTRLIVFVFTAIALLISLRREYGSRPKAIS